MSMHILAVVTVTLGSFSLAAGSSSARGPQDGAADKGGRSSSVAAGCAPAVSRGGQYFTFAEKFNRYYTDCAWQPSSTVYVSPDGKGDGSSRTAPTSVARALSGLVPGRMVVFLPGTYAGCLQLDAEHSGTYDNPVVLRGERQPDGTPGAKINCCGSGRKSCFNVEAADYVAIDGFELSGGDYGVRAVGADFAANQHQKGVAVLNTRAHGQNKDPFFTGQSDWYVLERCTGYDSGKGDGHGIYLSNGSDWNIVRWNETYNTSSSDFQINADPEFTCKDRGIAFADAECDAVAGSSPTGGRGASDYMLIEGNFFHHSKKQGPNLTSVRNSIFKNNICAFAAIHGTSFWQETDNPKLGSSNNLIAHNLLITSSGRHALQIIRSSTGNQVKNNVVVAVDISGSAVAAHARAVLLGTDGTTVKSTTFEHNAWISGSFATKDSVAAYAPGASELRLTTVDAGWFAALPTALANGPATGAPAAYAPTASAPWLDKGKLLPAVPVDRNGKARHAPTDLGPFER